MTGTSDQLTELLRNMVNAIISGEDIDKQMCIMSFEDLTGRSCTRWERCTVCNFEDTVGEGCKNCMDGGTMEPSRETV